MDSFSCQKAEKEDRLKEKETANYLHSLTRESIVTN